MTRVAFVRAESVEFTRKLRSDLLWFPDLHDRIPASVRREVIPA